MDPFARQCARVSLRLRNSASQLGEMGEEGKEWK